MAIIDSPRIEAPEAVDNAALEDCYLLTRVRSEGDIDAYGELWKRHRGAALTQARRLAGSDSEDIVADAFTAIWEQLQSGGGPKDYFRAYVLTVVRNLASRSYRDRQRVVTSDEFSGDPVPASDQGFEAADERRMITTAFAALPERWQEVLWLLEGEQHSRSVVAERMGIAPNAVSVLLRRAKEGLRVEWLRQMLPPETQQTHPETVELLPRYVLGALTKPRRVEVKAHLSDCQECHELERGLRRELPRSKASVKAAAGVVLGISGAGLAQGSEILAPAQAQAASVGSIAPQSGLFTQIGQRVAEFGVLAKTATIAPLVGAAFVVVAVVAAFVVTGPEASVAADTARVVAPTTQPSRTTAAPLDDQPDEGNDDELVSERTETGAGTTSPGDDDTGGGEDDTKDEKKPTTPPPVDSTPFTMTASGGNGAIAPVLSGSAQAGTQVSIGITGYGAFSVPVAADSSWSTDIAAMPLEAGTYSVTATAFDGAIQQAQFSLTLPQSVGLILRGEDRVLTVSGGVPGAQICIRLPGDAYQRVALDGNGFAEAAWTQTHKVGYWEYRYCDGARFGPFGSFSAQPAKA